MPSVNIADYPEPVRILFIIAAGIVALGAILGGTRQAYRFLRKMARTADYIAALPAFAERTDATLAAQNTQLAALTTQLTAQIDQIEEIHHETHKNDGSSIKDAVLRIEKSQSRSRGAQIRLERGIKGLYTRADLADVADAQMRKDFEDTHPRTKEQTHE